MFWHQQGVAPAFFRDRSVLFAARHDGQPHQYAIELPAVGPVLAIRIDPSQGPGEMQLSDLRLTTSDGEVLYQWNFD